MLVLCCSRRNRNLATVRYTVMVGLISLMLTKRKRIGAKNSIREDYIIYQDEFVKTSKVLKAMRKGHSGRANVARLHIKPGEAAARSIYFALYRDGPRTWDLKRTKIFAVVHVSTRTTTTAHACLSLAPSC